jgi:hypothetical protein
MFALSSLTSALCCSRGCSERLDGSMAQWLDGLVAGRRLKPSQSLTTVRLNGPKGPGTPGWEGSSGAGIRPNEKLVSGRRKVGKDAEGRGWNGRIYGRRESSEACALVPSQIGRPLNPGGQTPRLRLLL